MRGGDAGVVQRGDGQRRSVDGGVAHRAVVEAADEVLGLLVRGEVESLVARGDDGEHTGLTRSLDGGPGAVGGVAHPVGAAQGHVDDVCAHLHRVLDGGDDVRVTGVVLVRVIGEDLHGQQLGVGGDAVDAPRRLEVGLAALRSVGGGDAGDVLAVLGAGEIADLEGLVGVVVAVGDLAGELAAGGVDLLDLGRAAVVQAQVRVGGVDTGVDDGDDRAGAVRAVVGQGPGDALLGAGGVLARVVDALLAHRCHGGVEGERIDLVRRHRGGHAVDEVAEAVIDLQAIGAAPGGDEGVLRREVRGLRRRRRRGRLVLEHDDDPDLLSGPGLGLARGLVDGPLEDGRRGGRGGGLAQERLGENEQQ